MSASAATMAGRLRPFRHVAEMLLAMVLGMSILPPVFWAAAGTGPRSALTAHPVASLLVMAASMTVPMCAIMRYRGHSRARTTEMGLVMLAPAVPFVVLKACGVIAGPVCGAYCAVSTAAMVGLILYRRREHITPAR